MPGNRKKQKKANRSGSARFSKQKASGVERSDGETAKETVKVDDILAKEFLGISSDLIRNNNYLTLQGDGQGDTDKGIFAGKVNSEDDIGMDEEGIRKIEKNNNLDKTDIAQIIEETKEYVEIEKKKIGCNDLSLIVDNGQNFKKRGFANVDEDPEIIEETREFVEIEMKKIRYNDLSLNINNCQNTKKVDFANVDYLRVSKEITDALEDISLEEDLAQIIEETKEFVEIEKKKIRCNDSSSNIKKVELANVDDLRVSKEIIDALEDISLEEDLVIPSTSEGDSIGLDTTMPLYQVTETRNGSFPGPVTEVIPHPESVTDPCKENTSTEISNTDLDKTTVSYSVSYDTMNISPGTVTDQISITDSCSILSSPVIDAVTSEEEEEEEELHETVLPPTKNFAALSSQPVAVTGLKMAPSEGVSRLDKQMKHPLEQTWTFWYYTPRGGRSWNECQVPVQSVSTIEDFWAVHNWIQPPSRLKDGSDYSLFKVGILPDWEHVANKDGGRLIVNCERDQIDQGWLEIIMALVGDQLGKEGRIVNGAVVNARNHRSRNKFSLWLGMSSTPEVKSIGDSLRYVLQGLVGEKVWDRIASFKVHN